MTVPRQLPLDLPHHGADGRDDLIVGESNALAVDLIDSWPRWPAPAVILAGPPGSGKTHIARTWAERSGARIIDAAELAGLDAGGLTCALVEDAGKGSIDETALFHLLNHVRAQGGHCLITSRLWPSQWGIRLADLGSRLRAAPLVEMLEPDDELLRAVIVKLFADRQIAITPHVVEFLVARMERSLAAAGNLVSQIDAEALARGSRVTRAIAADVLHRHATASVDGRFDCDMSNE